MHFNQRVQPPALSLTPRYLVRQEVAQLQQEQKQHIHMLREAMESGQHKRSSDAEQQAWKQSQGEIVYYGQEFFDQFNDLSASKSSVVLGEREDEQQQHSSATRSSSEDDDRTGESRKSLMDERMADITALWNANDVSVMRKANEAEAAFIVKLICELLNKQVKKIVRFFSKSKIFLLFCLFVCL